VTDAWLTLLTKQEAVLQGQFVPKWDFDYPYDPATDGPRDSSAAAIAALGMLHLAEVLRSSECGQKYLCAAVSTLQVDRRSPMIWMDVRDSQQLVPAPVDLPPISNTNSC